MTREEAIRIIRKMLACTDLSVRANLNADMVSACNLAIKALEQEPRKGHWFVDERPESDREIICSNCEQPIFKYHKMDFDYRPKYCPNCGADMRGSEE